MDQLKLILFQNKIKSVRQVVNYFGYSGDTLFQWESWECHSSHSLYYSSLLNLWLDIGWQLISKSPMLAMLLNSITIIWIIWRKLEPTRNGIWSGQYCRLRDQLTMDTILGYRHTSRVHWITKLCTTYTPESVNISILKLPQLLRICVRNMVLNIMKYMGSRRHGQPISTIWWIWVRIRSLLGSKWNEYY